MRTVITKTDSVKGGVARASLQSRNAPQRAKIVLVLFEENPAPVFVLFVLIISYGATNQGKLVQKRSIHVTYSFSP